MKISRRVLLGASAASAAGLAIALSRNHRAPPKPTLPKLSPDARHVIVVSIDGLHPSRLFGLGSRLPTLQKLLAEGARTEGARSVWPSVTYPAHATMVTGRTPLEHGITNNYEFDPLRNGPAPWKWRADEMRGDNLWLAAHRKGLRVGACYWPVTVGAEIDYLFPQIWQNRTNGDDALLRSLTKPASLADELEAGYGALPAEHRTDRERADGAVHLLRTRRPELLFVYFTDYDTRAHIEGPDSPNALATLSLIDRQLERVVQAVDEVGAKEATTFVVVSDHGFAPVKNLVLPSMLLAEAKLLDVDARGHVTGYRAAVDAAGGLAAIVLAKRDDAETGARVVELFTNAARDPKSGIGRVYSGDEIRAKGGFPDAHLVIEAAPQAHLAGHLGSALVSPSPSRGSHGYSPERDDMLASLFLSGRSVKRGASLGVVSLLDVAPTVAALLGITVEGCRGTSLDPLFTALSIHRRKHT